MLVRSLWLPKGNVAVEQLFSSSASVSSLIEGRKGRLSLSALRADLIGMSLTGTSSAAAGHRAFGSQISPPESSRSGASLHTVGNFCTLRIAAPPVRPISAHGAFY